MTEPTNPDLSDSDNPLLELDADQQAQIIEAYQAFENSEHATDDNVNRRGVLAAIATLLTGSAIGGGAYALSTQEVEAAVAAAGQVGTASNRVDVFAESVNTDERFITNIGTQVHLSSNQSIPSASETILQFDTEDFDHRNEWDSTNHKFVAANDGLYKTYLQIRYGDLNDQENADAIIKSPNNGGNFAYAKIPQSGSNLVSITSSGVIQLSAGEEIEFHTFQNNGGSRTVSVDTEWTLAYILQVA